MSSGMVVPQQDQASPDQTQHALLGDSIAWHVVYTRPRHEKNFARLSEERGVKAFLPLYQVTRRWDHRHAEVELPLFPSYVFVNMAVRDKLKVLDIPSAVSLVSFQGAPAAIPDEQMQALIRAVLKRHAEPCPYLATGKPVRVTYGPLAGLVGIVKRRKNRTQVIVTFDWMCRSVAIPVEATDLEAAGEPRANTGQVLQQAA